MNLDEGKPGGFGVLGQPGKRQFVARSEHNQGVRGGVPLSGQRRKGDREVKSRMRRLATLHSDAEIGSGDQVNTVQGIKLPVRHMTIVARRSPCETSALALPPRLSVLSATLNQC